MGGVADPSPSADEGACRSVALPMASASDFPCPAPALVGAGAGGGGGGGGGGGAAGGAPAGDDDVSADEPSKPDGSAAAAPSVPGGNAAIGPSMHCGSAATASGLATMRVNVWCPRTSLNRVTSRLLVPRASSPDPLTADKCTKSSKMCASCATGPSTSTTPPMSPLPAKNFLTADAKWLGRRCDGSTASLVRSMAARSTG
mmetsp:Transcript_13767/g.43329  ORF Transcript_13767/g.43329 Transcript_13767/m.43329 type:complete len:201 (+) Transcript_13767:633-1235(+)